MGVGKILSIFVISFTIAFAEEVPREIVRGLESNRFIEREVAQKALLEWGESGEVARIRSIGALSRSFEKPELSHRASVVLRELSDRNYLAEGRSGFVGISMNEVQFIAENGKQNDYAVFVADVMESSPAEAAGLEVGDVIRALNGGGWKVPGAVEDFQEKIADMRPLTKVVLSVARGEEILNIKMVLGRRPVEDLNMVRGNLALLDKQRKNEHFQLWLKRNGLEQTK